MLRPSPAAEATGAELARGEVAEGMLRPHVLVGAIPVRQPTLKLGQAGPGAAAVALENLSEEAALDTTTVGASGHTTLIVLRLSSAKIDFGTMACTPRFASTTWVMRKLTTMLASE